MILTAGLAAVSPVAVRILIRIQAKKNAAKAASSMVVKAGKDITDLACSTERKRRLGQASLSIKDPAGAVDSGSLEGRLQSQCLAQRAIQGCDAVYRQELSRVMADGLIAQQYFVAGPHPLARWFDHHAPA